jgi:hypothetical protein
MNHDSKKELIKSTATRLVKMIIDSMSEETVKLLDEGSEGREVEQIIISNLHATLFELTSQIIYIQGRLMYDGDFEKSKIFMRNSIGFIVENIDKMEFN